VRLIQKAIDDIYGTQAGLATAADCSQQYISWLMTKAEHVSAEMAAKFDQVSHGKISKHELRPDIFGPKPKETVQ